MGRNNRTLRGSGMGVTVLKGGIHAEQSDYYLTRQTPYNLVAPQKGDTTITTSTTHAITANDYVLIDQLEDPSGATTISATGTDGQVCSVADCSARATAPMRPAGQIVKVSSVTSNTITLAIPLYWTYNQTPQVIRVPADTVGLGVEDLTIDNSVSGIQHIANMQGLFNSWFLRVEFIGVQTDGLFMWSTYRNTIRSCKFHDGYSGTNGGYTVLMFSRNSANLFEDNIVYRLGIVFLMDGAASGNVFAYNYATNMIYGGTAAGTGMGTHGAHPMMNLFEGNYMDTRFRFDFTWGTTSHNTMLRNRVINETNPTYTGIRNLIDLWQGARYHNVVGNVLGTVGQENIYEETSGSPNNGKSVYAFGEQSSFGLRGNDSNVAATVLRHGNWDSVNNSVLWDATILDHQIPTSYYLTSKPSFFGSCTWPPIGSDLMPMDGTIPAKVRYEGGSLCNGLPAPTGLRVM
jgi:hypothetical protein